MKNLSGRFCEEPFSFLFVGGGGNVYLCCPGWIRQNYAIGNIFRQKDLNLIWNSKKAKLFRKSVCDGSFNYCKGICPKIDSRLLPRIDGCSEEWKAILSNPMKDLDYLPKKVQFSYDFDCNLYCNSCRHTQMHMNQSQLKSYDQAKDTILKPLLKEAEILILSGSGELFASRHSIKYLQELSPAEFPKLRYHIMTNGQLFTEKTWNQYPYMQQMIERLFISIDAAKKETYEVIRRGGRWEVLMNNLNFTGRLRKGNKIKGLYLMFVVQKLNYREMVDFIQLGYEIGADRICFSRIGNWGIYSEREFIEMDVCDPRNEEHKQFLQVLKHPFFGASRVSLENLHEFRGKQG